MKTPHLGLLRMYGNTEVFFKTASIEPRLSDQIGRLVAGSLLEKLAANLPTVPGAAVSALRAPARRPAAASTVAVRDAMHAANTRHLGNSPQHVGLSVPTPITPGDAQRLQSVGRPGGLSRAEAVGPVKARRNDAWEQKNRDLGLMGTQGPASTPPASGPRPVAQSPARPPPVPVKPLQPTPAAPQIGTAAPKGAITPAGKPPPVPARANPSALQATPSGSLARPNVNDFTVNQGVTSSAPAAPAGAQMKSPLANPRVGGIATGGHAPNVNDFAKQPAASHAHPALGRLMDRAPGKAGPPTINPMEGTKDAPAAPNKPIAPAEAAAKPEAAAAKGSGGLPWNRMLLTGGLLGAGALGLGAMKAGLNFLGGGHGGPANYGAAPGGYMPPMGVNAYGQPQLGTPIM